MTRLARTAGTARRLRRTRQTGPRIDFPGRTQSFCSPRWARRAAWAEDRGPIQYHTARLRLVPQLARALNVPTRVVHKPGSVRTELPQPASAGDKPVGRVPADDVMLS